jgi:hypothetical protein
MFRVDIQFVHISIKITSKKMLLELLDRIEQVDGNRFKKIFKLYSDWLWEWARELGCTLAMKASLFVMEECEEGSN